MQTDGQEGAANLPPWASQKRGRHPVSSPVSYMSVMTVLQPLPLTLSMCVIVHVYMCLQRR